MNIFRFREHGTLWKPKFQNATPPTIRNRKLFKLFLNFLSNGPHKTTFGNFKILKIEILMIFFLFLNMGPYGSENFKMLLLQIAAKCFQTFLEFSSQWSS